MRLLFSDYYPRWYSRKTQYLVLADRRVEATAAREITQSRRTAAV